ncbi:peripheral-type benzodiazepine receptor-associated protein 1 [Pitangus sulphuratus]|nr:peripheral-type benzodiazepine receptor-associated protein 1 [Pitangus sulphuratus]
MERTDRPPQSGADYGFLVSQNTKLLSALEDLQHRCSSLAEENSLLRRSCFPQTEEKVKHLKRKNAELAVIAKRLEERARKLQEANLKVVTAPVALKGSSLEMCKKAFARQRAKDLTEQASALLAKDKQIEALQQECRELQAKLLAGKDDPRCLNVIEFDRLLRESQREVLRLQRQIALKNFKECLRPPKMSPGGAVPSAAPRLGPNTGSKGSPLPREASLGDPALGGRARREVESGVQPLGPASEGHENFPPKNAITGQESSKQIQQLEFELKKKRKKCENLEHEVRKKHKRCKELEIQLQEVQNENARLAEENLQLNERAGWAGQVESENADLKLQVVLVTKERDSVIQTNQGLQTKLENLEQVLKHMRNVAERRQQLEVEHKEALLVLQEKQEEVRRLQQAQAEARREHEGAVQLLEARVKDLEDQCRSQTEQFSLLSQELQKFRLQTGKIDLLTSTLVTSELPLALCSSTPQPPWEKESTVSGLLPHQSTKKVHNEGTEELESSHRVPDTPGGSPAAPTSAQKQAKKVESQSSSSKSESMHNSPKSCPTPEVDTASEMEELDVDSISLMPEPGSQGPAKLQVFLARYSYNPFDGPNENPEAELPLTAGEYIYIYGDMDEDGFFEGELMDGRRGLVPSNFVERVSDDDLVTFLPPELNDLTHSSYHEKSLVSASTSSGDKSDFSIEESSISPLASRAEGDQEEPVSHTAVPYPRKLTLIKQLARSIVVGWDPPLLPAGCPDIQSYNIYVDEELRQNVKSGLQTKAVIEKLDLQSKAYRVSVQAVTEHGRSDRLRCTFFVGQDFGVAPTMLKVRSVTATSAEVTWLPCNSNYSHAVYLNGDQCDVTKPGVYWYTFHNLQPSTQYVAKLEARPMKTPWEEVPEGQEQDSAVIHFTTPLAGTPDAPLDVQVEAGPSPGILVISWLPVTIDAEGSSNGVRVTGYAVYADGQKVIEVTSPTAGSVLVDLSQLQMFQVCREVSTEHSGSKAPELEGPCDSSVKLHVDTCSVEEPPKGPSADREQAEEKHPSPEPVSSASQAEGTPDTFRDRNAGGSSCRLSPDKEVMKEMSRVKREQEEKLAEMGRRQLALFSEHNRSSELSDILEEEEEDELSSEALEDKKWDQSEPYNQENGEKMDLCDTDSDEEILERILELPLQKSHSKKLFSIPEVTEDEEEEEDEKCMTEEKADPQDSLETHTYHSGRPEKPPSSKEPFPKADGNKTSVVSAQTPREEHGAKESRGDADHANPAFGQLGWAQKKANWNWGYQENDPKPVSGASPSWSKKKGSSYQEKTRSRPEMGRKRQSDLTEHCSRLLGNCSQMGSGLYRAPSLREELNVVSSAGGKEGMDLYSRARQGTLRKKTPKAAGSGGTEPAVMATCCSSPRSLEIDIEYDSEDDQDSTCASSPESRRWPERFQSSQGDWSDCSSQSEAPHTDGRRDLTRLEMMEEQGLEWAGSPSRHVRFFQREKEALRCESSSEEQGWELDCPPRSSAPETPGKEDDVRIFVALFDYDPVSMSPNPDAAEEELPFKEGQILKVCGDKDADGFYRGECAGREGYIPCNMVSEVQVDNDELKKQLLKQGFLSADTATESQAGLDKQEKYKSQPGQKHEDIEAELLTPCRMVAVFDYNPKESSPNADVEAELTFSAGDIITVFGSMDDDGFYYGELNQQRGLVPSNFLEAAPSDGDLGEEFHSKDKEASPLSAESQLNPDGCVDQSDSSPTPPSPPPSCLVPCPEQASLPLLARSDSPGQSKKKRSFFFKGKNLFKKLGSNKKN